MRAHSLDHVGDEPIYCETQHDEVFYSGSEDDYYEAPEHRRLRIEASAVQFLNGNLPYLLSARLKGPFDAKSWENPWRSKRAQRQAGQLKTQSRRSVTTVEYGRGHGSGKAIDDPTDTQRTSLYPLPSPEVTNPPSARKNSYMAEEEFNRIKTWRQTVKSVPVSTDPFWASQQDESRRSTAPRKRSADQDWLRKRDSKKRKSEDLRRLASEESPSQTAAKMRRNLLPGRLAEIITQSGPGSSTHEDELAAHWGPATAVFDTARTANIPNNTPSVVQTARTPQASTKLLLIHDPESSEDELSMPSVAPSRNTSRSPSKKQFLIETADNTPSRRNKRDNREALQVRRSVGKAGLDLEPDNTMSQRPAQEKRMRLEKAASRRAVGASQQDNSFHFHQAASKSPSALNKLPPKDQVDRTALNFATCSDPVPATANERFHREGDQLCAAGDKFCIPAPLDDQMDVDPNDHPNSPSEMPIVASNSNDDPQVAGAVDDKTRATQPQPPEGLSILDEAEALKQSQHKRQICTSAEPDLSVCGRTQEMSPVSMQGQAQGSLVSPNAVENPLPMTCPLDDDADASNPDWSTYIATQDLSTAPERRSSFVEATKDVEIVPQAIDDSNDPNWTTYFNTQDITGPLFERNTASKDGDGHFVVVQGPDGTSDPEWLTFVNTQDRSTGNSQCDGVAVNEDERGLALEPRDPKVTESVTEVTESDSELSSYLSISSPGNASQTGNISNEPVLAKAAALDSNSSQATLGAIINAYAQSSESQHQESGIHPERQLPIRDQSGPDAAMGCQDDIDLHGSVGDRQGEFTALTEDPKETPGPVAASEQNDQPMRGTTKLAFNFDETTVSFEDSITSVEDASMQSPWVKEGTDLSIPVIPSNGTTLNKTTSKLSLLADQALALSPTPQTPWVGGRLPSPDFSLSVKRFSDFMRPSPSKKRASADGSILRSLDSTSRALVGTPMPARPKRRVNFAPLPGEEEAALDASGSKDTEIYAQEDLSYFDAKGNKTTSIRVARAQTRAASPPPSDINTTDADGLPDHDHKFARHFEAMSKRKGPPRRMQRLLPSDSQQTNGSQAVDAMAEAFIQASQAKKKSSELIETVDDNSRLVQSSSEKISSPIIVDLIQQQENIDPVDDVSAVLDNIDDFLDNSWGFDTSLNIETEKDVSTKQQVETVPSRFANVGDPMLAMHANVWAD